MARFVDLISDTVTLPPPGMLESLVHAQLGDDYYHDDPTVKIIEAKAAALFGTEAALLVLSGTMGNLVSVMSQANPGTEAIVEQDAHIFRAEKGGMARLAGVMPRRVPGSYGILDPADVEKNLTKVSGVSPGTSLICVEDTHNAAGGTVMPLDNLRELHSLAQANGIRLHMDGARVFNAAVAQGVPVAEIAKHVDSITFCLSKGLCCPLGALVCGSDELIQSARANRQVLGGGMRQAGVIAAMGIWALDHMVDQLAIDHRNAKLLAHLAIEAGFPVDLRSVETNIVRVNSPSMDSDHLLAALAAQSVRALLAGKNTIRCVTHWDINEDDIRYVGQVLKSIAR